VNFIPFTKIKKVDKKHLVVSGCSFTQSDGTWPYHLEDEYWVHNVGSTGAGNSYIGRSVIYEVSKLLKEDYIDSDTLSVVIMWSGIDRKEFLSTKKENPLHPIYIDGPHKNWLGNFINENQYDKSAWLKSSISRMPWDNKDVTKFFEMYWTHFYSEEESLVNTLESIQRTQMYLESVGVKYVMMSWQNIFNDYKFIVPEEFPQRGAELYQHEIWWMAWLDNKQWSPDRYWPESVKEKISKDTPLLKDIYFNATHLWDLIDWDKWWFYEDDQVEYGGLAEWVCLKEKDPYGNGYEDPGHPSPSSHNKFANKIVRKLLNREI